MELRQLRYFARFVELGSISRAALDMGLVPSALSQQIGRLEGELSTRLLQRTSRGATPTEAGLAFFREAQLALHHAGEAARAAREARLSGSVSVGLAPTTASVVGMPLMRAMRKRYPSERLQMVEGLTGYLSAMLNARQLDLAVLFDTQPARRWSVTPLLSEKLYLISSAAAVPLLPRRIRVADLAHVPLILPPGLHGLRSTIDAAFAQNHLKPSMVQEIDSLAMLMDAVDIGMGSTVQPWAAVSCYTDAKVRFHLSEIADAKVRRRNSLCSLSDDELSPAALAARVVLADCARELVRDATWSGAALGLHDS